MKRLMLLLSGLLAALPALAAGTLADVQVLDRATGRKLPVYESGGRWFVAGKPGDEYHVSVRNRSGGDLLAVVSVDGVNVVSGETAAPSQSGYVIDPGDALAIRGWRKSLEKVAAFYFTDLGDSYAARTGRPDNVGVIGVAVFRRKAERLAEPAESRARESAGAAADHAPRSAPQAAQKRNRYLGFVFQAFNLLPYKTAAENVALPLFYQGVPAAERNRRAREYLERVGLSRWADHRPGQLSGGQQQRVAIARALVTKPHVILADEPTGALDTETSYEVMGLLTEVNQSGITVVVVTHEADIAARTHRTIRLKDGVIEAGAT